VLSGLHEEIEQRLSIARRSFAHPGVKGDASEGVWLELLNHYLPSRYASTKAHVVDSQGNFSDQIDIVIFDRQYSPLILKFDEQLIIPAESVYAVFESKQTINADNVRYAQQKISSVRRLHRTSLPIPHAGGTYSAKAPQHIIGGFLGFESDWTPPLGKPLLDVLTEGLELGRIDLGCIAANGVFQTTADKNDFDITCHGKPAITFLFELIGFLQEMATVPMIDIRAYTRWLTETGEG
jgi:hypothetical protein